MTTYREFTPDLEVRAAEQGGDGRTVVGIAVPYGRAQKIHPELTEQFARGAFDPQIRALANRGAVIPFARDHIGLGGELIGRATMLRDDAAGLYGEWYVSRTPTGDATLELIRDGALSHLSIGFRERKNRRLTDGTIERTKAELREVAAVLQGAYGQNATMSGVRADEDGDESDDDAPECPQCRAAREALDAPGDGAGDTADERAALRAAAQIVGSLPILRSV